VKVTALLVSHNGARWLPAVLAGLAASTRKIDAITCVDTGSTD
jgi:GT2 family glycosyltransferase